MKRYAQVYIYSVLFFYRYSVMFFAFQGCIYTQKWILLFTTYTNEGQEGLHAVIHGFRRVGRNLVTEPQQLILATVVLNAIKCLEKSFKNDFLNAAFVVMVGWKITGSKCMCITIFFFYFLGSQLLTL